MEHLLRTLEAISSFIWGPFLLIPLLLLTGLYLTIRLRGLQFRVLGHAFWLAFVKRSEKGNVPGDVSHYQALATALAATIGVGNIAGVATAIGIGGPGALFWMWMTGLVGMATKYSEAPWPQWPSATACSRSNRPWQRPRTPPARRPNKNKSLTINKLSGQYPDNSWNSTIITNKHAQQRALVVMRRAAWTQSSASSSARDAAYPQPRAR